MKIVKGGGGVIRGWRLFEIFLSKGTINRRTAFIRGNTVNNLYLSKQVMTVTMVQQETELSGSHNIASKKNSPFND